MKCRHTYLFAGLCALLFGACTGNFRDINDDLSGITDGELEADNNGLGYRLGIIQQGVYFNYDFGKGKNWPFQLTQNLNADMFSGYMQPPANDTVQGGWNTAPQPPASGPAQDGWNSAMWQFTYSYVMPEIYRLEQTAAELMPPFYAIAKILKVLAMQRVTDYYGPVIYTHFGAQGAEYVPDGQQEVYMHFFDDLDEAVEILSDYVAERPTAGEFAKFDLLLDGSYAAWLRFANSLRMRLAVRLASVAPEKARAEFRKAAADPYGVIEVNTNNAAVKTSGIYSNPLGAINRSWNEVVMNASMESVLTGFGDPRIAKFFEPCAEDLVIANDGGESVSVPLKGQYHGVRQGTAFSHNYYAAFSRLTVEPTTEVVLMSAAEVWFLRAEAKLRWTDAGQQSVKELYEKGIEVSIRNQKSYRQSDAAAAWTEKKLTAPDWAAIDDAAISSYINDDTSSPEGYTDPWKPEYNSDPTTSITVKWDEGASNEEKLERIITQKWIANFPLSTEAWADYRRTGYPKLFRPKQNLAPSIIDTQLGPRRLLYNETELSSNTVEVNNAIQLLKAESSEVKGDGDTGGTRLWWDRKDKGNF